MLCTRLLAGDGLKCRVSFPVISLVSCISKKFTAAFCWSQRNKHRIRYIQICGQHSYCGLLRIGLA